MELKRLGWLCLVAAGIAGCASGGQPSGTGDGVDAAATQHDAHTATPHDAASGAHDGAVTPIDASVSPIDAPPPLDAPPGSIFCNTDTDCTTAGQCCFDFGTPPGFCVDGTSLAGVCFPSGS